MELQVERRGSQSSTSNEVAGSVESASAEPCQGLT